MPKLENKNRRESTLMRDAHVHALYRRIMEELGKAAPYVSKSYIYERIHEETKLSDENFIRFGNVFLAA